VDTTLPELHAAGLHTVKAVVPGLLPISFGRRPWPLGGDRLTRLARALGGDGAVDEGGPPHFFT
jgi:hypothetical protein